jgi:hypothetical protein
MIKILSIRDDYEYVKRLSFILYIYIVIPKMKHCVTDLILARMNHEMIKSLPSFKQLKEYLQLLVKTKTLTDSTGYFLNLILQVKFACLLSVTPPNLKVSILE